MKNPCFFLILFALLAAGCQVDSSGPTGPTRTAEPPASPTVAAELTNAPEPTVEPTARPLAFL